VLKPYGERLTAKVSSWLTATTVPLPTVGAFEGRLASRRKRQVAEAWVEPKGHPLPFCSHNTAKHEQRAFFGDGHTLGVTRSLSLPIPFAPLSRLGRR
jgi:hypothetical protein